MTESSDANWDELGVAWRAVDPNVGVIASKLAARLSRQSQWMTAVLVIGLPLCGAGVLFGVATICLGYFSGAWNFMTRGIAMIAMSAVLAFALWSLRPVRFLDSTSALSELIDLAIDRAQRTLSLIRAAFCVCSIAVVFGLIGTAIRTHFSRSPRMSPLIDLAMLGLIVLMLRLYGRQIRVELGIYRTLKHALAQDATT